jgi:hypothetical protein
MDRVVLRFLLALFGLGVVPTFSAADEVSLVSGLFKTHKEKNEVTDEQTGTSNELRLGGRYGIVSGEWVHLLGLGLGATTFESSEDKLDPANAATFDASYGLRRIFATTSEALWPFLGVSATAKTGSEGEFISSGFREKKVSGLFYSFEAGLRTMMGKSYFLDITCQLFESALFSKTEETLYSKDGETIAKTETTDVELFADTAGSINDVVFGLGMIF